MANIKTVSDSHFEIDGDLYPRIFSIEKDKTTVTFQSAYTGKWLDRSFEIEHITIDSKSVSDFDSEKAFLNELKKTVFKKGGGGGNTGSQFTEVSNLTTADYIYKSGMLGTAWQVNRYDRNNNMAKTTATQTNNTTITTLADAVTGILTLNYS